MKLGDRVEVIDGAWEGEHGIIVDTELDPPMRHDWVLVRFPAGPNGPVRKVWRAGHNLRVVDAVTQLGDLA